MTVGKSLSHDIYSRHSEERRGLTQMAREHPFQELLRSQPKNWDRADTPLHVFTNFSRVANCGTSVLGAEVYATATETKIIYHRCKSRFCPSCGVRATQLLACISFGRRKTTTTAQTS